MKRESHAKTVNQTFSIPVAVSRDLHAFIKRREMSSFVSDAIIKELEIKKQYLKECYRSANEDAGQIETTSDWKYTLTDGLDEK